MNDLPKNPSESFRRRNPHVYGEPRSEGDQEMARDATGSELDLHIEIINHCNSQSPRWKYIHANPARRSTIATGAQDFTIFLPGCITLCVECKSRDGKLDADQQIWQKEMQMIGHTVFIVRSIREFLEAVEKVTR